MKRKNILLVLMIAIMALSTPWTARAEDLANYRFVTGTSSSKWITLSSNATTLLSSGQDDKVSSVTTFPNNFSFTFGGNNYSSFWVNDNGVFSFSSSTTTSGSSGQFTSSYYNTAQPKICGIARDMTTGSNGYVKYELTGTSPNRILVCEFKLTYQYTSSYSSLSADVTWQVQLYEVSSSVVIVYGSEPSTSPSTYQTGIGVSGSNFWVINTTDNTASHRTSSISTTYSSWPPGETDKYRYYEFGHSQSLTVNTTTGGTVSGSNSNCTYNRWHHISATPNAGYRFLYWKEGDNVVNSDVSAYVHMNAPHTYTAYFEPIYTNTAIANPTDGGTVAFGTYTYDFDDHTTQGWTNIDSDEDKIIWDVASTGLYVWSGGLGNNCGYNSSADCMASGSYTIFGAKTPDNYLVSPKVQLGGSISFYAKNVDSGYPEQIAVAVSTSGNTDASDFTTINSSVVTLSGDSWTQYTVSLSNYSGEGYVAIRNYGTNDQYVVLVDDITIVPGSGTSVTGTFYSGQSCSATATAASGYNFTNWTESGSQLSSNATYTFTTSASHTLTANFSVPAAAIPYTCNFENTSENNQWEYSGSSTNQWIIGTSTYYSSSHSLYISNDGSSNAYSNGSASYVYAYRHLNFTSAGDYKVSFKWKANGESSCWDAMYAALCPPSVTFPPTNIIGSTNSLPSDYINASDVSSGAFLWGQSSWQTSTKTVNIPSAGVYTLVFYWKNDGSDGSNPPAAVDDIDIRLAATYNVTVSANGSGSVSGGGNNILEGTSVTVTATADAGYNFVNWTENGTVVSTDPSYTFILESNRNLVANFEAWAVNITSTPVSTECLTSGTPVVLTASTNIPLSYDYTFTKSTESFNSISGSPDGTSTNTGDAATFAFQLPFAFNLAGKVLPSETTVTMRCDGHVSIGSYYSANGPSSPGTTYTVISPLGYDQNLNSGESYMYYKETTENGTRVLIMEWKNMRSYYSTNSAYNWTNYQVKLYEGSNIVKLCYGSFTYNYSCLIYTYLTADGKMTKITGSYANPVVETNTTGSTTSISVSSASAAPANGTVYTFTPDIYTWTYTGTSGTADGDTYTVTPTENSTYTASVNVGGQTYSGTVNVTMAPAAPTGLSVSNITTNSATVSWTGSASSYKYSTNGGSSWTTTSSTSVNLSSLSPGTNYTFLVKAVSGTCESADVSTSFTTLSEYTLSWSNPTGGTISVTQNGSPVSSGASWPSGTQFDILATECTGYNFNGWTATSGSTLGNASNASTTLILGTVNTTLEASFISGCTAPTNLTATPFSSGAVLIWDGDATEEYTVEYRAFNGTVSTTTEDFSNTTAVDYDDSPHFLPTDWMSYNTSSSGYDPRVANSGTYSYITALTGNYLLMTTTATGQAAYVIMPQYSNLSAVTFNYAFEDNDYCGNLEVGYVTSNTGYSTFTRLGEAIAPVTSNASFTYALSSSDIATINSNNGYIAFKYNSASSTYYSVAIDDIIVTTMTGSYGSWTTASSTATSPYTLTVSNTNTTYQARVKDACGNSSDEVSFKPACTAPSNLAVTPSNRTAEVTWIGGGSYNVGYASANPTYDFESTTLPSVFSTTTTYSWIVVENSHSGTYCAKSGNGGVNSSESDMELTVSLTYEGVVTFDAMISSESSWDKGYFYIDGTVQNDLNGISGSGSWNSYSYNLTAGSHTLRWLYTKDNSQYSGDDCLYVDDIKIYAPTSTVTTNNNSFTLTGLTAETDYLVIVQSSCGSDWVGTTFTTLNEFNVTANVSPNNSGTVTGAGYHAQGSNVTLTATPAAGYAFQNWTINGSEVGTNSTYTINNLQADVTVQANFIQSGCVVTVVASPTGSGTFTISGTGIISSDATSAVVNPGGSVTITATSSNADNYVFAYWTDNGNAAGTVGTASLTLSSISESHTVVAHFAPLKINNSTQWNEFCDAVNHGFSYNGETVTLEDDIETSEMAGTDSHKFSGTFDGGCNTITFNQTNATEQYIAPFRYINSATIQNLKLVGTVSTTNKFAGGIVAHSAGTSTITNCVNSTYIEGKSGTPSNNGSHGGIIGQVGGSQTITITGCVFNGTMTGNNGAIEYWCGIMGFGNNVTATISDCIFDPEEVHVSANNNNTICRTGQATVTNCYYTQTMTNLQGKQAYTLDFAASPTSGGTVSHDGSGTEYGCSGITAYTTGLAYDIDSDATDELILGEGESASITASANSGYTFMNWIDGSSTPIVNPYDVTMGAADRTVTANFVDQMAGGSGGSDCVGISQDSETYGADGTEYMSTLYGHTPFVPYFRYGYQQIVYPGEDLPSTINSISFKYKGTSGLTRLFDIYMAETTENFLSDWMSSASLTLVYEGSTSYTFSGNGEWNEITLTTPFSHTSGKNIVLVIYDKTGTDEGFHYQKYFYSATSSYNVHKWAATDTESYINTTGPTIADNANVKTYSGAQYPIIKFCSATGPDNWVTAVTSEPSGYSESGSTITISNEEGLAWLISKVNGLNSQSPSTFETSTITLTADVDMSAHTWVPIGTAEENFSGTFDGNGHVITGLIRSEEFPHTGLFGYVSDAASIQNVVVQAEFTGNSITTGAVVGTFASTGTISNVEGAGTLTGGALTTSMGGLVGINTGGTIHSSFAVADLTSNASATMGGLVGVNNGNLYNSYANGTLNGTASNKGGLVGSNASGCEVKNCYAAIGSQTFPAFANTNAGTIEYCYTNLTNGYTGSNTGTLQYHGTYNDPDVGIKHLNYMYRDNAITLASGTSTSYVPASGTVTYANNHTPKWNGLVSALNQWVDDGHTTYSKWHRPLTTNINGDLPVLGFPKDNALATLNSDKKFLQYGSNQNSSNGIDGLLSDYNDDNTGLAEPAASIFHYGKATGVANVPTSNVNVFIAEDAVLLQASGAGAFTSTVGVTFDNSDHGQHAYDYWGNKLNYDWHLLSTPLYRPLTGAVHSTDQPSGNPWSNVDITNIGGYFPNGLITNDNPAVGGSIKWDFYTYYEPQYHWINLKRNKNNHYHQDSPNDIIIYNEPDQDTDGESAYYIPGKGYEMAINQDTYMNATGTLNRGDVPITLTNQEPASEQYAKGWNLVGNPYQAYLDIDKIGYDPIYTYDADQGTFVPYTKTASVNPAIVSEFIHPHQAFFVHAKTGETTETLTFTQDMATTSSEAGSYFREKNNYPLVNLFADDDVGHRDLTVIEFHRPELGGAPKLDYMRTAPFNLAAHYAGTSYGILFATDDMERVPVKFKPSDSGLITLTWSTHNGEFRKLLLIDNKLGVEHNMLADNSYTFEASPDDYSSRFYIVYDCSGMGIEENEDDGGALTGSATFAYISHGNIVIDVGTGHGASLQVIDVLGRVLYSKTIAGTEGTYTVSTRGLAKGVYLIRLADGHNVKTQKLVVQ